MLKHQEKLTQLKATTLQKIKRKGGLRSLPTENERKGGLRSLPTENKRKGGLRSVPTEMEATRNVAAETANVNEEAIQIAQQMSDPQQGKKDYRRPKGSGQLKKLRAAAPTSSEPASSTTPALPVVSDSSMAPDPESEAKRRKMVAILREICRIENLTTNFVKEKEELAGFSWDELIDDLQKELVLQDDEKEIRNMETLKAFEWMKLQDVSKGENLITTTWARKLKDALVRSWPILRNFELGDRVDVFSPTYNLCVVRYVLFRTIVFALRVELADLVPTYMQAKKGHVMFAFSPGSNGQDGWCRRVLKTMNGVRTVSEDFSEFLPKVLTNKMCSRQGKLELCLFIMSSRMRMVDHVDDLMAVGEHEELVSMWRKFNGYVLMRKSGILNNSTAVKQVVMYYQAGAEIYKMKKTSARVTFILEVPELDTTLLDEQRQTKFRSDVEKMQFVKSESEDVAYALQSLAHHLHEPDVDEEQNIERMPCNIFSTVEMQQYPLVGKKGARWHCVRRCHGGRAAVPNKLESTAPELDGLRKRHHT